MIKLRSLKKFKSMTWDLTCPSLILSVCYWKRINKSLAENSMCNERNNSTLLLYW
jgi:hypothetical protein